MVLMLKIYFFFFSPRKKQNYQKTMRTMMKMRMMMMSTCSGFDHVLKYRDQFQSMTCVMYLDVK